MQDFKMLILERSGFGIVPLLTKVKQAEFLTLARDLGLQQINDFAVYLVSDYDDGERFKEMHFRACQVIQEYEIDLGVLLGIVVVFSSGQDLLREAGVDVIKLWEWKEEAGGAEAEGNKEQMVAGWQGVPGVSEVVKLNGAEE